MEKPEENRPFERSGHKWDNMKIHFKKAEWEGVDRLIWFRICNIRGIL
jgi:hypothetical protein